MLGKCDMPFTHQFTMQWSNWHTSDGSPAGSENHGRHMPQDSSHHKELRARGLQLTMYLVSILQIDTNNNSDHVLSCPTADRLYLGTATQPTQHFTTTWDCPSTPDPLVTQLSGSPWVAMASQKIILENPRIVCK